MRNAVAARTPVRGARKRPLESWLIRKRSRSVRRGAIGKVPARVTRWWPTLPHAPIWGGCAL